MVNSSLKNLYSRIYCQTSSANNALHAVGNSEGKLFIFDISKLMPQKIGVGREKLNSPLLNIPAHNDSIYSLASSKEFCIMGATGVISGWNWKGLRKGKSNAAWSISLECDQSNFGTPEVNSLAYDHERHWVFAACGDWRTRGFDLETGKETISLSGHEDYVHDVVISGNQVVSAGEDGQVLIWDPRIGREPRVKLKPYTHEQVQRPRMGKFISSVDVENDWLICGGGPQAGIFHLRSLALTTVFQPDEPAIHVTKFTRQGFDRGSIVVAGASSVVHVCNISGEVTAEIPSSSPFVYSIHVMEHPNSVRILGFKEGQTQFGEFPWVAMLLKKSFLEGKEINVFVGGASLIHKRVVMTAAHKVANVPVEELVVRLGEYDTASTKESIPYQNVAVEQVIIHPKYFARTLFHDIALLVLKENAKEEFHIAEICPAKSLDEVIGSSCVTNGWGVDAFKSGNNQKIMKSVVLPMVDKRRCENMLRRTRLGRFFSLHESFMCAGGEEGVDACEGDGGGPLSCQRIDDPTRYLQVGITAWGIGCGGKDIPGVYVDVALHYHWIMNHVNSLFPEQLVPEAPASLSTDRKDLAREERRELRKQERKAERERKRQERRMNRENNRNNRRE